MAAAVIITGLLVLVRFDSGKAPEDQRPQQAWDAAKFTE
jgi:hypothetical protein